MSTCPATAPSASTVLPTTTPPSTSSTKTTTSPLNRIFILAPDDLQLSHFRYATVWKVAKIICIIAPFAIVAASYPIAIMAAWNPENIFLFVTACAAGLQIFSAAFSSAREMQAFHTKEAAKYTRIAEIHAELKRNVTESTKQESAGCDEKHRAALEKAFDQHGLTEDKIEKFGSIALGFRDLTLGLAHLIYANEKTKKHSEKATKLADAISESTNIDERRRLGYKMFAKIQKVAFSKIQAAHYFGLMKHPFSTRELSTIGTLQKRNPYHLMMDLGLKKMGSGGKSLNQYFIFHDKNQTPLVQEDIQDSTSLEAIADKLFHPLPT